jgi:hypothetical protein
VTFSRTQPGLPISAALHAGLIAAALLAFSDAPKFNDAQESIPVEVLTDAQLNQVMKGEKTARAPRPTPRAERVAERAESYVQPPRAEAKREVQAPPPPVKRLMEAGEAEEPSEKTAKQPPTPPKRAVELPTPARAVPPARAKAAPQPEEEDKSEAEVVRPKPPTRPKLEPAEKTTPTTVETSKEKPRLKVDEVARLLKEKKLDKTATSSAGKPKSGEETAPRSKFNAASIANLLSHEAPQQRASAAPQTQLASLGAPAGAAAKMSASLQGRIDAYTVEHYRKCWVTALSMNAKTYVPHVEFRLSRSGALEGEPRLLNPSSDPVERARGEQALAAVRRCSPMPIPAEFTPYYDYWRVTELVMKEDM